MTSLSSFFQTGTSGLFCSQLRLESLTRKASQDSTKFRNTRRNSDLLLPETKSLFQQNRKPKLAKEPDLDKPLPSDIRRLSRPHNFKFQDRTNCFGFLPRYEDIQKAPLNSALADLLTNIADRIEAFIELQIMTHPEFKANDLGERRLEIYDKKGQRFLFQIERQEMKVKEKDGSLSNKQSPVISLETCDGTKYEISFSHKVIRDSFASNLPIGFDYINSIHNYSYENQIFTRQFKVDQQYTNSKPIIMTEDRNLLRSLIDLNDGNSWSEPGFLDIEDNAEYIHNLKYARYKKKD